MNAEEIVARIIKNIGDRRGLGEAWDEIADDIKEEIIAEWKSFFPQQHTALTFDTLRQNNLTRVKRWHGPSGVMDWIEEQWSNAMAGEAGEACNAAKKLRRLISGMQQHAGDSAVPKTIEEARKKVLKEVGDTVIYGGLLCERVGGTLEQAVRHSFNSVSEREGFPERI